MTIDLSSRVQWSCYMKKIFFNRILLQPLALKFFTLISSIFPETLTHPASLVFHQLKSGDNKFMVHKYNVLLFNGKEK